MHATSSQRANSTPNDTLLADRRRALLQRQRRRRHWQGVTTAAQPLRRDV
jgi:hypothetical protein